jgi:chemotaxis protein CheX
MHATPTLPSDVELAEIVAEVWTSFLGDPPLDGSAQAGAAANRFVTGWVSISGDWAGEVHVTTTAEAAQDIAAAMLQLDHAELGVDDISDAIGEIANVIGGSVKSMVGGAALSLPQVVLDVDASARPDAERRVTSRSVWRGEPIEIALWEHRN